MDGSEGRGLCRIVGFEYKAGQGERSAVIDHIGQQPGEVVGFLPAGQAQTDAEYCGDASVLFPEVGLSLKGEGLPRIGVGQVLQIVEEGALTRGERHRPGEGIKLVLDPVQQGRLPIPGPQGGVGPAALLRAVEVQLKDVLVGGVQGQVVDGQLGGAVPIKIRPPQIGEAGRLVREKTLFKGEEVLPLPQDHPAAQVRMEPVENESGLGDLAQKESAGAVCGEEGVQIGDGAPLQGLRGQGSVRAGADGEDTAGKLLGGVGAAQEASRSREALRQRRE